MKIDLSLGKILLGFAGVSVAVCAYNFYSSNNNEAVSCYDGEDIIPSELQQSCCTEDEKIKSSETSNELVSVDEVLFAGRNKLLINPKIEKNLRIKPVAIYPDPKVSPAISCVNLNEVIKLKEILERDSCLTRVENKSFKSTKNEDFTQVKNVNATQDDFKTIKNNNFTQVENDSSTRFKNEAFTPVENESFTAVENNCSTQVEKDNLTPVKTNNSAPVENKDLNISYVFDENYLKNVFLRVCHNQQNVIAVKYHMDELKNLLKQMENTELTAVNRKKLVLKRFEQLRCKSTQFFTFENHQIELKAWEIYSEETKNRKTVHDFKDLFKVFKLIKQFYGDTINIFEKSIEIYTLELKSKEPYMYNLKNYLDNITKQINIRFSCISQLDDRLVETVEKINTLYQSSYSSTGLNVTLFDEIRNLTFEADLLESKQIFDSLVTNLRVDKLSNNVLTQQKQLEQTLTDLSNKETTAENYTSLINKRIKQLQEASGENNLQTELFSCELTKWTSLSTDPNISAKFPKGLFDDINLCYGYLINALASTDNMKSKQEKGIQIESGEINELIECYELLLHTAKNIENFSYLLILKVVVKLQSELVKIF